MKTRPSSGVGSKVDLKFDPDTLKIEDRNEDEEDALTVTTAGLVDPPKDPSSIKTTDDDTRQHLESSLQLRDF